MVTRAQTIEYVHTDPLGSPVAITNQAGQVIERIQYEPFGTTLAAGNSDRPGYTGHVMDSLTLLTNMQQRYYDPAIGRFLSTDPVLANANTGASFNRYWYANNNPYKFTDPNGRAAIITYKRDGSISIQVPINYSGPANTEANRNALAADVSSRWSGTYDVGGTQTIVNVSVVAVDANTPAAAVNNITLLNGPTSNVQAQGASFVRGGNSGEWNMSSIGMDFGEGAHETGHLMGAGDHYSDSTDANGNRVTTAAQGYAGNLMAQLPGVTDSRVMGEVLSSSSNVVIREPPPPPDNRTPQ